MQLVVTIVSTIPSYSAHDVEHAAGCRMRGKLRKMIARYDFSPVFRPIQNGELVRQAQDVRQRSSAPRSWRR